MRKLISNFIYFKRLVCISMALSFMILLTIPFAYAQQKPILIGVYGPMTGPAANVGLHIKNGALLAIEDINGNGGILGRKVEPVFADTESKPAKGVSAFERTITTKHVALMAGGLHSDIALATMDVTAKHGIPQMSNGPVSSEITKKFKDNPKKYRYFFKSSPSSLEYGRSWSAFLEYLVKNKLIRLKSKKTVAFVLERTSWGRTVTDAIMEKLRSLGWEVGTKEIVAIDQSDYLALLSKLKRLKPDVIIATQTSPAASSSFVKQARQKDVQALFCYTYAPLNPQFLRLAGDSANGLVWQVTPTLLTTLDSTRAFIDRYSKKFNMKPQGNAGLQYDIMHMIKIAYERAGSLDAEAFVSEMEKMHYLGTPGIIDYALDNHEVKTGADFIPTISYQIRKGQSYMIWPERYAQIRYAPWDWILKGE